ncbi:hypothetical protein HZH68_012096 [Vespula germanica]|uniref:Uncharacterized protein n=1 Tax=Vespula germanica TaxID=30212 RepID=A0A834JNY3_VESGE|nr:hypothetical protein HZH68_012096 [Vespula germanica]
MRNRNEIRDGDGDGDGDDDDDDDDDRSVEETRFAGVQISTACFKKEKETKRRIIWEDLSDGTYCTTKCARWNGDVPFNYEMATGVKACRSPNELAMAVRYRLG